MEEGSVSFYFMDMQNHVLKICQGSSLRKKQSSLELNGTGFVAGNFLWKILSDLALSLLHFVCGLSPSSIHLGSLYPRWKIVAQTPPGLGCTFSFTPVAKSGQPLASTSVSTAVALSQREPYPLQIQIQYSYFILTYHHMLCLQSTYSVVFM